MIIWKHKNLYPSESSTSTGKPYIYAKKVLCAFGGNQKGVIHYEMLKLTAQVYQQQLIWVSDALEEKRPFTINGRRKVTARQGASIHSESNTANCLWLGLGNFSLLDVFFRSRPIRLSSFQIPATSPSWFPLTSLKEIEKNFNTSTLLRQNHHLFSDLESDSCLRNNENV